MLASSFEKLQEVYMHQWFIYTHACTHAHAHEQARVRAQTHAHTHAHTEAQQQEVTVHKDCFTSSNVKQIFHRTKPTYIFLNTFIIYLVGPWECLKNILNIHILHYKRDKALFLSSFACTCLVIKGNVHRSCYLFRITFKGHRNGQSVFHQCLFSILMK